MPIFIYRANPSAGELPGAVASTSTVDVIATFRKQKIEVISVKKKSREISFGGGKVTGKDVVVFTRQFATMVEAGLPLVQCLSILSTQSDNKKFAKAIGDVKASVENEQIFVNAIRRHPKIFDNLYCNMVEAGEVGGILDTIFK